MSTSKSLRSIFAELPQPFFRPNAPDVPITGISIDSRAVKPGYLFVAMKGGTVDGHDYIPIAIDHGAAAVVGSREMDSLAVPYIRVD
ncbi:MAG TPA: Mur ligase domain-containing protein, partial [Anaerolineales bacterium]|nr:Mur ligase domain-containing protein [Anaerolineales bacterium]